MVEDQLVFFPVISSVQLWVENLIVDQLNFDTFDTLIQTDTCNLIKHLSVLWCKHAQCVIVLKHYYYQIWGVKVLYKLIKSTHTLSRWLILKRNKDVQI